MNNHERNYRIKYRTCLKDDLGDNSPNYNKYYKPKWADFMRRVMSARISSVSSDTQVSFKDLPEFRKIVSRGLKTEILAPLSSQYDEDLTRMLLEVAPFFDSSPDDLKCHVIAVFGIKPSALETYLDSLN